jgi:hypothetical protein
MSPCSEPDILARYCRTKTLRSRAPTDAACDPLVGHPQLSSDLLTQVQATTLKTWSTAVPDARYFRTQAELCRQLAQQISNRTDAEYLRAMAKRFLERALALENGRELTGLRASKTADE